MGVESYDLFIQSIAEDVLDEEDQYRYNRFTSFSQKDRSFYTPWSSSSSDTTGDVRASTNPEFMNFQSAGSFFSYEIGGNNLFMGKAIPGIAEEKKNEGPEKEKQSVVCSRETGGRYTFPNPYLSKDHTRNLAMAGNTYGHAYGCVKHTHPVDNYVLSHGHAHPVNNYVFSHGHAHPVDQ